MTTIPGVVNEPFWGFPNRGNHEKWMVLLGQPISRSLQIEPARKSPTVLELPLAPLSRRGSSVPCSVGRGLGPALGTENKSG